MGGTRMIHDDPALRDAHAVFRDRTDAGKRLAEFLSNTLRLKSPVVLAIPAGGIPCGIEVARVLRAKLRLAVVRKVQIPWNPEAGFGAVAWDGSIILNDALLFELGLSEEEVQRCIEIADLSVRERMGRFRGVVKDNEIADREVVLIDDGLASGFTMIAAVRASRRANAAGIIVAVPTSSARAAAAVVEEADEVVCLNLRSGPSFAVADAYRRWHDLTEEEALVLLGEAERMGLL